MLLEHNEVISGRQRGSQLFRVCPVGWSSIGRFAVIYWWCFDGGGGSDGQL